MIDEWNAAYSMRSVPWCATGASGWAKEGKVSSPKLGSAAARKFAVSGYDHTLSDVMLKRYTPKAGDFRVKTRRGGNHVDLFVSWDSLTMSGVVIGGNVSDKITLRRVSLKSMVADGTYCITEVCGNYEYETDSVETLYLQQFEDLK